jgi:multidrug efflux pump subunit AcrA (membrane-fusion protein)
MTLKNPVDFFLWTFPLYLVIIYTFSCNSSHNQISEITFSAQKASFNGSVEGNGELIAKRTHNISSPMIWEAMKISFLLPEGTWVTKDDIVAEIESQAIENAYLTASDELEIARAEAIKRDSELSLEKLLLESQLKSLEATVAASRLRLADLYFEPPRKQEIERLSIEKDEIELHKIQNKLTALASIQKEERIRYQLKIKQEKTKRDQAKQNLEKLTLKAPVDGFVVYAKHWRGDKVKEGDPIWAGSPVVEIPDLSVMQVKLLLGETEAQKCEKDQAAIITIPSLKNLAVSGKVYRVARMAKPVRRNSKIKKVEVLVELDSTESVLVPGISARGKIITNELEDVYAVPYECLYEKDSVKIVYKQNKGHFEACAVAVQQQSDDFLIIKGDLQDGVNLALNEPHESLISWPDTLVTPQFDPPKNHDPKSDPDSMQTAKRSPSGKINLRKHE